LLGVRLARSECFRVFWSVYALKRKLYEMMMPVIRCGDEVRIECVNLLVSRQLKPTMKQIIYILTLLLPTICGQSKSEQKTRTVSDTTTIKGNSVTKDTVELKETFNEEDLPANEYLTDKLKPIRANFKRINSIINWTTIDTEELSESTEGGEAKFYYQNGQLEKIVARHYGETFQLLTEYYLLNGQLSFVFEKRHKYNRPLYYDTTAMKENNDIEAFDFDKSEIIEDRSYFDNGKLLHQINNQDCGSPFADDYVLDEQKRIKTDFDKLIKQTKENKKPNR
jgi:hypothetical protein